MKIALQQTAVCVDRLISLRLAIYSMKGQIIMRSPSRLELIQRALRTDPLQRLFKAVASCTHTHSLTLSRSLPSLFLSSLPSLHAPQPLSLSSSLPLPFLPPLSATLCLLSFLLPSLSLSHSPSSFNVSFLLLSPVSVCLSGCLSVSLSVYLSLSLQSEVSTYVSKVSPWH